MEELVLLEMEELPLVDVVGLELTDEVEVGVDLVVGLRGDSEVILDFVFEVLDKDVHRLGLRVAHDRHGVSVDHFALLLRPVQIRLVRVNVVLISGSCLNAGRCSVLSCEILQAVRDPDIYETKSTNCAEPLERIFEVARSVVPMHAEHAAYEHAPADGFECILEPKYVLDLECVVLDTRLLLVVFEQVLLRGLVVLDVFATELMDSLNFL